MLLGCIGDDFTGSSDLGLALAKEGMRTVQYCNIPKSDADPSVEAGIVSLKSRTCPVEEAVAQSLDALAWLKDQGCRQFLFKYCSTFDSTPEGNIGPVIDALMAALDTDRALVCPAFPTTGRKLYQGHLFVGDVLLSDSSMRHHPLTPMTDSDIRRWLAPQTRHAVGHVPHEIVTDGADSVRAAFDAQVESGRPVIVGDAIADGDLRTLGAAARDFTLITGGSGIAIGLPANFHGPDAAQRVQASDWHGVSGPAILLSGSCSSATQGQVARYAKDNPALALDPVQVLNGTQDRAAVTTWLSDNLDRSPLVYSTAPPDSVGAIQEAMGKEKVADAIETLFAEVAVEMRDKGVRRIIVAGGETSGAVTSALGVDSMQIGPQIAPGVPALYIAQGDFCLALKSGNFGAVDFFETALDILAGGS